MKVTPNLTFSIIIPTCNRPQQLGECLEAIAAMNYPREQFEVIIVDDGSEHDLSHLISEYEDRLILQWKRQVRQGPAVARNEGVQIARGKFVAFTDDDCLPDREWLSAFERQLEREPAQLVGGKIVNNLPRNPFSAASQMLISFLYDYYNGNGSSRFFTSNNFALQTDIFRQTGGFDVSFEQAAGEDREFCDRLVHRGFPLRYLTEAVVLHAHPMSFASYWRQHFNYGRGAFRFHTIRAEQERGSFRIEPLSFYARLILFPFRKEPWLRACRTSFFLLIAQFANFFGFLGQLGLSRIRAQRSDRDKSTT